MPLLLQFNLHIIDDSAHDAASSFARSGLTLFVCGLAQSGQGARLVGKILVDVLRGESRQSTGFFNNPVVASAFIESDRLALRIHHFPELPRRIHSESNDIAEELARLSNLTIFELRGEWRQLHRAPPPMRLSRDLLMRGITYKVQERRLGGLSKSLLRKLERLNHASETNSAHKPPPISLKAGTRLVREWRGVTHTVLVEVQGFEWNGRQYGSLTIIAQKITGAHWSGPRFFGLRKGGRSAEDTEGEDAQT
jgi:hypothetical protein